MGDINLQGCNTLTYEQLLEKRKKKKLKKRLIIGAAAAVLGLGSLFVFGSRLTGILRQGETVAEAMFFDADEETLGAPEEEIPDELPAEEPEPDEEEFYSEPEPPLITGWQSSSAGRYYIEENGDKATGWFTDTDGNVYLFGEDGYALTGWQEPDIGRGYFSEDGVLTTGFATIDGEFYCFGYDGVNLTGWQDDGDKTYYFSPETGAAVTGWQEINGEDCYFNEDGTYDPSVKKETDDGPAVAFTFDDGPGEFTNRLLDILDRYDADATFFMIGEQVNDFAAAVQREHDMGMEQGNHSWDHRTLTHLSAEDVSQEVSSTNDVIRAVTGENPTLFRPPGGGYNDTVIANSFGMPMIMWSIDTLDWSTKNADQTYNTVMDQVQDGDIILMHEIYSESVDAAERLIPALQERGFKLVTVSELARRKGVTLTSGYSYGRITAE